MFYSTIISHINRIINFDLHKYNCTHKYVSTFKFIVNFLLDATELYPCWFLG